MAERGPSKLNRLITNAKEKADSAFDSGKPALGETYNQEHRKFQILQSKTGNTAGEAGGSDTNPPS